MVHFAPSGLLVSMTWSRPSTRVRDLIRQSAQIIVNAPPEWLDELDAAVLGANPAIAADPGTRGRREPQQPGQPVLLGHRQRPRPRRTCSCESPDPSR